MFTEHLRAEAAMVEAETGSDCSTRAALLMGAADEIDRLDNDNEVLTQEIHAAEDKVARLQQTVKDFMSYFDPQGGVSDVPLGPFERAKEDHPWLEDE